MASSESVKDHFKWHIERAYINATGQAVVQVVYSTTFRRQTCDLAYGNWKSLVSLLSSKNNQQVHILYEQQQKKKNTWNKLGQYRQSGSPI